MKRRTSTPTSRREGRDKARSAAFIRLEEQFRAHVESEEKWQESVTRRLDTVIDTLTPIVMTNTTILRGVPDTQQKGIVGEVAALQDYVKKDERRWAKLVGAATAVSAAVSVFVREVFK